MPLTPELHEVQKFHWATNEGGARKNTSDVLVFPMEESLWFRRACPEDQDPMWFSCAEAEG